MKRKEADRHSLDKQITRNLSSGSEHQERNTENIEGGDDSSSDSSDDFVPSKKLAQGDSQSKLNLVSFSPACERRGVSDRGVAQLALCLLSDIDKILPEEQKLNIVVDKNNVRRARSKIRKELQEL